MATLPNDQRSVDRLTEPDFYRSEKITGLVLEIRSSGSRKWRLKFQVGQGATRKLKTWTIGDARKIAIGRAESEARERLAQVQITRRDPRAETRGETFDALTRDGIEKHGKAHKRSWKRDLALYEGRIKQLLGVQPTAAITRQDVIIALDSIAKTAGPIQANRCQALVSACFSWALDEGRVKLHPAMRIRKRGKERASSRALSDDELRSFWNGLAELPSVISDPFKLLTLLGQRRGEVAGLCRKELATTHHGTIWTIPAERTKNKLIHAVPLPPTAEKIVQAWLTRAAGQFLFSTRVSSQTSIHPTTLSARFCDLMRDLKIEGAVLHTLRHTVKTNMAALGVPDNINDRVMNQVTGQRQRIGSRYDHHEYFQEKRRALELWAARLHEIIDGKSSGLRWETWLGLLLRQPLEDDPELDREYGPILKISPKVALEGS